MLGLVVFLLWPEREADAVADVGAVGERRVISAEAEEVGETGRAKARGEMLAGVDAAWETQGAGETLEDMVRRRLEGFGVVGVEMEGWTIREVVEWLRGHLVELGSADLDALADLGVRGVAKGTVTIEHEGQANGWAVLGLAAAQVGMRVEVREDGNVVLVEDADGGDVEAAEAALKEGLPGVQVLLKTKLIELREDGILEDQVLSGEEVELLIRQLSRSKGVDLMTAPSVVTRAGQEARVEIGEGGNEDVQGIKLGTLPMVAGEQFVQMDGTIDIGGLSAELTGDGRSVTEYGTVLVNGQTAALLAVDGENGKKVLALVTGSLQDPSGRPVALPGGVGE